MEIRTGRCVFVVLVLLLPKGYDVCANDVNTENKTAEMINSEWNSQPCDSDVDERCGFQISADAFSRTRTERDSPGYCPDGWYTFGENCYKASGNSRKGWNDAADECRKLNADLVTIHSTEEQEFLKLIVMEIGYHTWIGLRRSSYGPGYSWRDSSPVDFTNWYEGEPNNLDNMEECAHMRFSSATWNDAMCGSSMAYICKKRRDASLRQPGQDPSLCSVPPRWLKMKNSCYKVFEKSESNSSWSQAQSLCMSYQGSLVYVNGDAITTLLRLNLPKNQGPFWIGIKSTKKHKYTRLGRNEPLVYSNWKSDEPAELQDEQNCVAIDSQGEWMVRDCDQRLPFICEVGGETSVAPTLEPYHRDMTCPYTSPKWHDLGGKYCYIIELNSESTWSEAACLCSLEGGYLASFHSIKEVKAVTHYVKHYHGALHIGFERNPQDAFIWSDGSPTDFVNWDSDEPNDVKEQCAEMKTKNGKWNDMSCAVRNAYICSAAKVPVKNEAVSESSKTSKRTEDSKTDLRTAGIVLMVIAFVVAVALFVVYRLREKNAQTTYSAIR